jgi:hypothetical protein
MLTNQPAGRYTLLHTSNRMTTLDEVNKTTHACWMIKETSQSDRLHVVLQYRTEAIEQHVCGTSV